MIKFAGGLFAPINTGTIFDNVPLGMKKVLPQIAFDFEAAPEQPSPATAQVQEESYPAGVGVRIKSLKSSSPAVTAETEEREPASPEPETLEAARLETTDQGPETADEEPESLVTESIVPVEFVAEPGAPVSVVAVRPATTVKSKRGRKSLKQATAEADLIEVPADEILFSKQYYTMGEVAEMFRVNQSLLRFWETEFNILQPKKNKKGDRHFRPVDIKNLHLIYHLLRQRKYTIEGAKEFLKKNKKAEERFEAIKRLQQIRAFLLELKAQA